ncbi:hypothetical protein MMC14_007201 [Varicellaria rhodocarpa]|nr:hypothetical protein [Varicellaria rhodocarpa]
MTVTYIQACKTYWRETGLLRLLNDCAPPVQERKIPPPIMLSILTQNGLSFGALLRYDVDVNKRWGLWTPLLLSVAKGLPHFVSQLIEKGAHIDECIKDETAMSIAHVLSDSRLFNSANENQLLWDLFDWAPLDRSRDPFTRFWAQRYTDTLLYHLLKAAGASFNVRGAAGNLPLETAILTGKLWIADLLIENRLNSVTTPKDLLKDLYGRNILFYALEDEVYTTAENLLRQGYDINASSVHGSTPLHEAAERSSLNTVIFCLYHGANGLQKDYYGRTAFICSASLGNTKICKAIVDHVGSQVFQEWTAENETFLHCTAKPDPSMTLQVLTDLYLEVRAIESENLPNLYEVVKHTDIWGSTCLQTACCPRYRRSKFAPNVSTMAPVEKLLSLSASPSQAVSTTDYMLDTPLHYACC